MTTFAIIRTPQEKVVRIDILLMALNKDVVDKGWVFYDLECGHKAKSKGYKRRMVCIRCTEILRRSIKDGSEDYESFRKGIVQDKMVWKDDPMRQFNEPTDLAGNFLNDDLSE